MSFFRIGKKQKKMAYSPELKNLASAKQRALRNSKSMRMDVDNFSLALWHTYVRQGCYNFATGAAITSLIFLVGGLLVHYDKVGDTKHDTFSQSTDALILFLTLIMALPYGILITKKTAGVDLISSINSKLQFCNPTCKLGNQEIDSDSLYENVEDVLNSIEQFLTSLKHYNIESLAVTINVIGLVMTGLKFITNSFVAVILLCIIIGNAMLFAWMDYGIRVELVERLKHSNVRFNPITSSDDLRDTNQDVVGGRTIDGFKVFIVKEKEWEHT